MIPAPATDPAPSGGPRIELHVHLEGTLRPERVLELARRHDVALPATTVDGLRPLFRYTGFRDFLRAWSTTTAVLRDATSLEEVAVDHAAAAAAAGVVHCEAVVSPPERVGRGQTTWAQEWQGWRRGCERARDEHGVDLALTVDLYRGMDPAAALQAAHECVAAAGRGVPVVGLGIGGAETAAPLAPYVPAFDVARAGGLGVVPHAGETGGPGSVSETLDLLAPDRLRHGVTAARDPAVLARLARAGTVCDVTPVSNLRLGVVASLATHPLPRMVAAGVRCSLGSDDPAFFDTSLEVEHRVATALGVPARRLFDDAAAGCLCGPVARRRWAATSRDTDWDAVQTALHASVAGRGADELLTREPHRDG